MWNSRHYGLVNTDSAFYSNDDWIPVSEKLISARRLVVVLVAIPVVGIVIALWLIPAVPSFIAWIVAGLGLVSFIWLWWLIGRRVRSYAYCERESDLLVTSGILFRRLVIVPYGRMQLVDVTAGPIDRAFGVTTVQIHTAAATTDAAIPGLVPEIAAAVRDRLAKRGESRAAGL
jgi:membrane protein YdbS with pleckstrin-like domain